MTIYIIGLDVRHPVGCNIYIYIYVFMLHFIYLFLDHCISHFSNKIGHHLMFSIMIFFNCYE